MMLQTVIPKTAKLKLKFITFEGCDFCGKSTQVKLLKEFLENKHKKVFITREPGGSYFAEQVRNLLLSNNEITCI